MRFFSALAVSILLVSPSADAVEVFSSYAELRGDADVNDDLVFVEGRRESGDGGEGLFASIDDASAVDDGGTVLVGVGGAFKRANMDGNIRHVEWFETRLSNLSQRLSPSLAASELSPDFYQITNAIASAGDNGTLHFAEQEYVLDQMLIAGSGQTFIGHGTVITRPPDVVSSILDNTSIEDDSVVVEHPERFGIGHTVILITGRTSKETSRSLKIIRKDGDRLFFNREIGQDWGRNIEREWPTGSKVLLITTFLRTAHGDEKGLHIKGITFDGNSDEAKANLGWRYNWTAILEGRDTLVENCHFVDIPAENITGWGGVIRNNYAENLNGSFYHVSIVDQNRGPEEKSGVLIEHNIVDGATLMPFDVNGHNKGVVTFSRKARRFWVVNNRFENVGQCAVGLIHLDKKNENMTNDLFITGNHFRNAACGIGADLPKDEADSWRRIIVTSNIFQDVGDDFHDNFGSIDVRDNPYLKDKLIWDNNIEDGAPRP